MKKKNSIYTIIIVLLLLIVSISGGYYLGGIKAQDADVINNIFEKNYIHVIEENSNYNMYAYNNEKIVISYNDYLYELTDSSCINELLSNNECKTGGIYKTDIKDVDISKVYILDDNKTIYIKNSGVVDCSISGIMNYDCFKKYKVKNIIDYNYETNLFKLLLEDNSVKNSSLFY